jgi:hypothetical protein
MTLLEFADRFKISLTKARKMHKENLLRVDESVNLAVVEMQHTLRTGHDLSAVQLCHLLEHPGDLMDLGRYAGKARDQIDALGDVTPAPLDIVARISPAARNDVESVDAMLSWLAGVLPGPNDPPASHAFIAVRLLLGSPENIRKYDAPRIPQVMRYCRKRPEFAGWHRIEKTPSKNMTLYRRPANLPLDI